MALGRSSARMILHNHKPRRVEFGVGLLDARLPATSGLCVFSRDEDAATFCWVSLILCFAIITSSLKIWASSIWFSRAFSVMIFVMNQIDSWKWRYIFIYLRNAITRHLDWNYVTKVGRFSRGIVHVWRQLLLDCLRHRGQVNLRRRESLTPSLPLPHVH